jgi:hypothetical protein
MISRPKQSIKSFFVSLFVLSAVMGLHPLPCSGQKDSVKTLKNTISINITNPMIFGEKYNTIGYERVIKDYQTISGSIGRFGFPKIIDFDTDSIGIKNEYHDKGFHFSLDYRFYLKNENKHPAPRGVYLGPYYALNYFRRGINWDINTATFIGMVTTDINLTANLVGVQLGYQFIVWKRLSIDMVLMGPGMWFFKMKTDFGTSMEPDEEAMLLEQLNEMLKERFPGTDLVIQGADFEAKQVTSSKSIGLRYMVNLGFRF